MSQDRSNSALSSLQNKISQDPSQYDKFRAQGDEVIGALPNYSAALKESMTAEWRQNSAKGRFDGMMNTVRSVEDIDKISLELAGGEGMRDWQSEMKPVDYEGLMNALGSMRKTFNDKNNTDARSLITTLEERMKGDRPTLIPTEELQELQQVASRATDRTLTNRTARIMRDQDIIRTKQRLPLAELRAQKNAMMGNPGAAYPDLPVEASDAINKASEVFDVSAGLLGAIANREYGSEFAKGRKSASAEIAKFKPNVTGTIDVRNMRSDIVDAVTLAGMAYGGSLTLTQSTGGVTTPESGVNIMTLGMTGEDKAKITSSLVDAGFTGISEYDGYIQAAMTHVVPESFGNKEGKVWGGWTYLSPEVAKVLQDKGFKAGAEAGTINRNQIAEPKPKVNYDAPTGILDENGNPTSTARGMFQFVDKTWLSVVKDPAVAGAMGIDPSKMTDEEILALRGDPLLSTLAGAAYAKSNERQLTNALGRPVNDAEIYMAHFMGAGGAAQFLTAMKNNPDQSAVKLMPGSAKANKPVFYQDGKVSEENELTVAEVYGNISRNFTLAPSKIQYDDAKTLDNLITYQDKAMKTDPVQWAIDTGAYTITPLSDPNGFSARGAQARSIAEYQTIPMKDFKPFTQAEEQELRRVIGEGTTDENIELMANIQSMGMEPAKAALKQLEQTDKVFAYSAGLYLNGSPVVAGDIARGRKRLTENPALVDQIGKTANELGDEFTTVTGGALYDIQPSERQAIQDAATALYVERMATGSGDFKSFNRSTYEQAVQDAMGAKFGAPSIAEVNGVSTYIPQGITAQEFEDAARRMTVDDWIKMSEDGKPPRYIDSTIVDPRDIGNEVMFRAISNGQYNVMLDDGSFLITGDRDANGRMRKYIFVPDAQFLRRVSMRPSTVASAPNAKGRM